MGSSDEPSTASSRSNEVRDVYASMIQGEPSGEETLAASEQMLTILLDSMTNAVFWKDLDSLGTTDRDMPWCDDAEYRSDWFIDWDQAVLERRGEVGDRIRPQAEQRQQRTYAEALATRRPRCRRPSTSKRWRNRPSAVWSVQIMPSVSRPPRSIRVPRGM